MWFKGYVFVIIGLCVLLSAVLSVNAQQTVDQLLVADFNSGEKPNNLGGDFGTWDYDPSDETQSCVLSFAPTALQARQSGYAIALAYDVASPNPAFNGFWMKLDGLNIAPYNQLVFWAKGEEPFTTSFKVELKNNLGERAIYFIKGITDEWQQVLIYFQKARGISDWTQMSEFTVVFSDRNATVKKGTILIDDILFRSRPEE